MDTSNLPADTEHAQAPTSDAEMEELLGAPPLLEGENRETYNAFHNHVRAAIAPTDFIEQIWARDLSDLTWEILRLRRYKAEYHNYGSAVGFRVLVNGIKNEKRRERLIADFCSGTPAASSRVNKYIGNDVSAWVTIGAHTLKENFDVNERFDQLIAQAEARRNAVLREIDRHRDSEITRRLRQSVTEIQDAEFEDVSASGSPSE